jgi:hypothetical protein
LVVIEIVNKTYIFKKCCCGLDFVLYLMSHVGSAVSVI